MRDTTRAWLMNEIDKSFRRATDDEITLLELIEVYSLLNAEKNSPEGQISYNT